MKLQSLAVIFIIIIMPITMVLSEYINNKIETQEKELLYDTRLLNSTYDAIKAYQLNTVNNEFGDVTNEKINDILAASKTFLNSLSSSFDYTGYNSDTLKEYVPAVVFTMYDGYYTYSPYINVLTNVEDSDYDEDYSKNGKVHDGLKPYVYYSCRYTIPTDNSDFTIVYTLDNYITIEGMIRGEYVYDYGYLYSIANSESGEGIYKKLDGSYMYNGIQFKEDDTEELKEYVGESEYSYVKINGKKYYLDENAYPERTGSTEIDGEAVKNSTGIFFLSTRTGEKDYSTTKGYLADDDTEKVNNDVFLKYYRAIKNNKSAYEYYKEAYEFSSAVLGKTTRTDKAKNEHRNGYNLENLKSDNANLSLESGIKIFDGIIQKDGSKFNQHRKEVIRNVVETNLKTAIASFSSGVTNEEFIMPKISEEDWEIIENEVCAISFMQGMSIGSKKYNGYSVVANTMTKEYVDENDIYILANDTESGNNIYCKVNDKTIGKTSIKTKGNEADNLSYYPGIWKINFETKQYIKNNNTAIYIPIKDYIGSYTSIMGSYGIDEIQEDMYTYVKNKDDVALKNVYYKALGRERWGAYNVNNINYELNNGNGEGYFLDSYGS